MSAAPLLVFDCDSTLSTIEGVDELARLRGPECLAAVESMTNEAMDGHIAVEAVFGQRLEIIRPSRADLSVIGQRYIETLVPGVVEVIRQAREAGWQVTILSGGFRDAIRPLADYLGIERVEAVDLVFDETGDYAGFDEAYPTTRSGGKPEVIRRVREELQPRRIVMVGDGVSDLETQPEVDRFIGFGGVVARERVRAEAAHFTCDITYIPTILGKVMA